MGDTTKRNAVRDKVVALQDLADDLHDEILRLRELAIKERATVMRQAEELARLRAILAALREPSEAVCITAWDARRKSAATATWWTLPNPEPMYCAIRAAVAAAEQEVDRG